MIFKRFRYQIANLIKYFLQLFHFLVTSSIKYNVFGNLINKKNLLTVIILKKLKIKIKIKQNILL